ncbi:hypothetical protein Sjap_020064 [Stephania japonica]|uniref:Uncharacterized protein n=1 Tax=Stephania japonica TaxID=461633 RepID=A0AAP0I048_9MAGN
MSQKGYARFEEKMDPIVQVFGPKHQGRVKGLGFGVTPTNVHATTQSSILVLKLQGDFQRLEEKHEQLVELVHSQQMPPSLRQVEIKRTIPKGYVQSKDFNTKNIFVAGMPTTVTEDIIHTFYLILSMSFLQQILLKLGKLSQGKPQTHPLLLLLLGTLRYVLLVMVLVGIAILMEVLVVVILVLRIGLQVSEIGLVGTESTVEVVSLVRVRGALTAVA